MKSCTTNPTTLEGRARMRRMYSDHPNLIRLLDDIKERDALLERALVYVGARGATRSRVELTNDIRALLAASKGGEAAAPEGRFRLRLICCGLEEDVWPQHGDGLTWDDADSARKSYINVADHVRQAIIEPYPAKEASDAE